jgi:hypothetical protein
MLNILIRSVLMEQLFEENLYSHRNLYMCNSSTSASASASANASASASASASARSSASASTSAVLVEHQ